MFFYWGYPLGTWFQKKKKNSCLEGGLVGWYRPLIENSNNFFFFFNPSLNVLDAFLISGVNLTQHQLQQNIKLYTKLQVGFQQQMKKLKMLFLNPPLIIRSLKIIYFKFFFKFYP